MAFSFLYYVRTYMPEPASRRKFSLHHRLLAIYPGNTSTLRHGWAAEQSEPLSKLICRTYV